MEKIRCGWTGSDPLYIKYHDEEWGNPIYNDAKLFEFLILETFQAGLSWLTILKKRENFRNAFDNFDYTKIAQYNATKTDELANDAGIIRNKQKIHAAICNANAFMAIQQEFGSFSAYIWNYVGHTPIINNVDNHNDVPATTPLSDEISADMKKRGFKFVGSTVIYAHMQATGMVDDHINNCFRKTSIT